MNLSRVLCLLGVCCFAACASAPQPVPTAPSPAEGTWRRTAPPAALPLAPSASPVVKERTLPTGLRVVVVEHRRRPVVMVHLVLPHGSLSDPPGDGGLTFLAVQLASDYYEKSAAGAELHAEKSFRQQVYEAGGAPSFMTDQDFSLIEISGYSGDTPKYLGLLAGALLNPRHGEESYAARRDLLLDTLEELESSDPDALGRFLSQAAFGWGHPYARPVIGSTASLNRFGLEDLIAHQRAVLSPKGATLLVTGDVNAEQVFREAAAAFGRWRGPAAPVRRVPSPTAKRRAEVGFIKRHPAATLLTCACRPLPAEADEATLEVLAAYLGAGVESRLASALREANGLTYDASAMIVRRQHARAFLACSPLRADQGELGVRLFQQTLQGARESLPSPAELARAKGVRIAALESSYDDAVHIAEAWVEALGAGEREPRPDLERQRIEAVTAEAVQQAARWVLDEGSLQWVLSGEKEAAARAAEANRLGTLRSLLLER